jgi:large subunit ribosomal protein L15
MKTNNLTKIVKKRKRVGRGNSSGKGRTSGRGSKGQKSRSGHNIPTGFEGGQTPIKKRLPKFGGFKRTPRKKQEIVNLDDLNSNFKSGDLVSPKTLSEKGLVSAPDVSVKILGRGKLDKKLKFKKVIFSSSAKADLA